MKKTMQLHVEDLQRAAKACREAAHRVCNDAQEYAKEAKQAANKGNYSRAETMAYFAQKSAKEGSQIVQTLHRLDSTQGAGCGLWTEHANQAARSVKHYITREKN